jgi:hypothetical protein
MKAIGLLLAAVLGALPAVAQALCYTVYGANQVIIWRGTDTPIDLSRPVHEGMRKVFPQGSFLVIEEDTRSCTPVGPADFFGPMPGLTGPVPGVPGMQGGMTATPATAR